jgi:hypothetical protein
MLVVHLTLEVLGIVVSLLAAIIYPLDIHRRRSDPHVIGSIAVSSVLVMTFAGTWMGEPDAWSASTYLACFYAVQGAVVLWLLYKRDDSKIGEWDFRSKLCLVGAVAGGVLLIWLRDQPEIGVMAAIVADGIAYIPNLTKTWSVPSSQKHLTYTLSAIGAAFTAAAGGVCWPSLFPVYLILIDSTMVVFIFRPQILRFVKGMRYRKAT